MDLPTINSEFTKSKVLATVESVKAVGEVYCPFTLGKVVEANESLKESVSPINTDPEGQGWLVKLEINKNLVLDGLMEKPRYDEICNKGGH